MSNSSLPPYARRQNQLSRRHVLRALQRPSSTPAAPCLRPWTFKAPAQPVARHVHNNSRQPCKPPPQCPPRWRRMRAAPARCCRLRYTAACAGASPCLRLGTLNAPPHLVTSHIRSMHRQPCKPLALCPPCWRRMRAGPCATLPAPLHSCVTQLPDAKYNPPCHAPLRIQVTNAMW